MEYFIYIGIALFFLAIGFFASGLFSTGKIADLRLEIMMWKSRFEKLQEKKG